MKNHQKIGGQEVDDNYWNCVAYLIFRNPPDRNQELLFIVAIIKPAQMRATLFIPTPVHGSSHPINGTPIDIIMLSRTAKQCKN